MRGLVAFLGWLVGSYLLVAFGYYVLDAYFSDILMRIYLIGGEIAIIVLAIRYGLGGEPKSPAESDSREVEVARIRAEVERRFHGRVYIIPREAKKLSSMSADVWPSYNDEDWDKWESILKAFPNEPRTQNEAIENEVRFWRFYSDFWTETDSLGRADLIKHADIVNVYKSHERWILRRYFAATGKIIDPAVKEQMRLHLELRRLSKFTWNFDENSRENNKQRSDIERLEREIEHYQNRTMADHMDKWSKWFAAHVEDQFKRDNKPAQPTQDNTHGEGGYATAEDINRLNRQTRRQPMGPAAHDQVFDE